MKGWLKFVSATCTSPLASGESASRLRVHAISWHHFMVGMCKKYPVISLKFLSLERLDEVILKKKKPEIIPAVFHPLNPESSKISNPFLCFGIPCWTWVWGCFLPEHFACLYTAENLPWKMLTFKYKWIQQQNIHWLDTAAYVNGALIPDAPIAQINVDDSIYAYPHQGS